MKRAIAFTFIAAALVCSLAKAEDLDFGDRRSETLTGKAWNAFKSDNYANAIIFADKCIEMYEKQAIEMQKELKEPVPDDDKEAVSRKWALNDVGTCMLIKGQALEKQDKKDDAIAVYKKLIEELPFSQCWDPKGWFWKPAGAAKGRLKVLDFDSQK